MNAQIKRLEKTMTRKISSAVLVIGAILATACGSAELAPCQVLPSVQGGYVLHFTLNGTAAGCPAEFSDLWGINNNYPADIQGEHGGLRIDYRSMTMPQPDVMPGPPNGLYGYGLWDAEFTDANASCTMPSMDAIVGDSNALDGATTTTDTYTPTALTYLSGAAYQWYFVAAIPMSFLTAALVGIALVLAFLQRMAAAPTRTVTRSARFGSGIFPVRPGLLPATTPLAGRGDDTFWETTVSASQVGYPSIGGWKGADQALP
jgi:hypothetical protein